MPNVKIDPKKRGARNPRYVRFTMRVDERINAQLEYVADRLGHNKSTVASLAMAAGLSRVIDMLAMQDEPERLEMVVDWNRGRVHVDEAYEPSQEEIDALDALPEDKEDAPLPEQ